jgi:general secretion pathway protein L
METLVIRLFPATGSEESPPAEWLVVGNNRLPVGESTYGTLAEAATAARQRRAVVLVPSEQVLLTRTAVTARSREQLMRAIPFALEEDLAEDVEQLHFAPGPRQPDGTHPVAIVTRAHMSEWLAQLSSAGMIAHALIPDVLALPLNADGDWSLLLENDRALLRAGAFSGYALELDSLEDLLGCVLEDATPPPAIAVYGAQGEDDSRLPKLESIAYRQHDDTASPAWAAGIDDKHNINLLQGQYRARSDLGRMLKPWRAAAALLGVWIALQAVETGLDYRRLAAEDRRLAAEIEQIYRQTFPGSTRVVNPRVQMEQQLNALRQASASDPRAGFMPLLAAGFTALKDKTVDIETLDYTGGRLQLSLNARELQTLEAIKQALEGQAFTADIESAETRGSTVSGRLVVQEARG